MTDPATIAEVAEVIAEELSDVTPAMIEAGSRELTRISITRVPDPKKPGRMITMPAPLPEDRMLTAIWRAMLHAKLSEPAGTTFARG